MNKKFVIMKHSTSDEPNTFLKKEHGINGYFGYLKDYNDIWFFDSESEAEVELFNYLNERNYNPTFFGKISYKEDYLSIIPIYSNKI